jgi:hypothetical protein
MASLNEVKEPVTIAWLAMMAAEVANHNARYDKPVGHQVIKSIDTLCVYS